MDPNQVLTWTGCGITRKAFMSELAAAYERKTGIRVDLSGGGATKGIRDTQASLSDLGGSCRWTLENPRTLRPIASEAEVKMVPVAWDALVVIVNPRNPADTISLEQLRQVYTGAITNWKDLGSINAQSTCSCAKARSPASAMSCASWCSPTSIRNSPTPPSATPPAARWKRP